MALRLRQVVLVAPELGPALEEVRDGLGIEPCYHDPGVAEFGLENVLFPVGHQFVEVVAPVEEGTTAGRMLDRRGGAGGYMVMVQCDDLDRRRARLAGLGVRTVWQGDLRDIRGTHLHPKDIGGAIVSMDETTDWDEWRWAGPAWRDHVRTGVVNGIAAVTVAATDPEAMAARWSEVLDARLADATTVQLDDATIRFVPDTGRGEGVDAFDVVSTDRERAGTTVDLCGTRFTFV
jgi:hypothetical protein